MCRQYKTLKASRVDSIVDNLVLKTSSVSANRAETYFVSSKWLEMLIHEVINCEDVHSSAGTSNFSTGWEVISVELLVFIFVFPTNPVGWPTNRKM